MRALTNKWTDHELRLTDLTRTVQYCYVRANITKTENSRRYWLNLGSRCVGLLCDTQLV